MSRFPQTPDGRYFVSKGRLWRTTNPKLPEAERERLVKALMKARRDVYRDRDDAEKLKDARSRVHAAKVALGERGPVWWDDGAEDVLRKAPKNTRYADWWDGLSEAERKAGLS
ncbi:hypothetical protein [uncultured Algimonas sp.]|uniref:hypothetical protein n=1 Tax=uncultured Algimonas sp. TaxID=1547920 RepID=UPI002602EA5A|nr:hypothetical protein [uncultured Algimonas sp.]